MSLAVLTHRRLLVSLWSKVASNRPELPRVKILTLTGTFRIASMEITKTMMKMVDQATMMIEVVVTTPDCSSCKQARDK